jgi:hypothetical protein
MMAMGWTDSQIRRVTGITPHRLSLYRADPAFSDIVAKYSKRAEDKLEEFGDFFNELMQSDMLKGELAISDALDDHLDGEREISLAVLDKIVQGRADRTGYGKTSKVEHKHDFAMRLENAIQRSGVLIEGRASPKAELPTPPKADLLSHSEPSMAREPDPAQCIAPEPPNLAKVVGGLRRRRLA